MSNIHTQFVFSVITPTYNRSKTLSRAYNSLVQQTFRSFEWIIIDDGSTDDTRSIVLKWQKEKLFPIIYKFQKNSGKPSAVNRGIRLAKGKYILILDSDDSCKSDAMDIMVHTWQQIPLKKRARFVGVTGLCENQYGKLVGDNFPKDVLDSTPLELSYYYKIQGEKWGFLRADVLREIPLPITNDFVPESIWWHTIAKQYKTRYINKVVRTYYVDDNGTEQLSTMNNPLKYAKGHAFWHQWILNEELAWFWDAPLIFIRSGIHYSRFSFLSNNSLYQQYKKLNNCFAKVLWLMLLPIGLAVYIRDVIKA